MTAEGIQVKRARPPQQVLVERGTQAEPAVIREVFAEGPDYVIRVRNPEKKAVLPIFLFHDGTVSSEEFTAVKEALADMLRTVDAPLGVSDFGNWCEEDWKDKGGNLRPDKSIAWLMEQAYDSERDQWDATTILNLLGNEPYQKIQPHHDILITGRDLFFPGTNFVIGGADPDLGTVISTARFRQIKDAALRREVVKTAVYHEGGHVWGLPFGGKRVLEKKLGYHCPDPSCSMKQGLAVPRDFIKITEARLRAGHIYCSDCLKDLEGKRRWSAEQASDYRESTFPRHETPAQALVAAAKKITAIKVGLAEQDLQKARASLYNVLEQIGEMVGEGKVPEAQFGDLINTLNAITKFMSSLGKE